MNSLHSTVPAGDLWAVKNNKENRILSPRFRDKSSAEKFSSMIQNPEELDKPTVTLAQIARDLKIPAIVARAALRKLGMTPESGRWKIPTGTPEYDYIRKILNNLKRKH